MLAWRTGNAEDFYLEKHAAIFRAVHDLYAASKPVDELSVSEALVQRNEIDEAGGKHYVSELAAKVPDMSRCVFNLHVPPYDSRLDTAAELDEDFNMVLIGKEPHMIAVGSTGVRRAIEEYQPMVALHGHIHESAGMNRIGRTLCVNPGSDYHTGRISGCLVTLRRDQAQHQFVTG